MPANSYVGQSRYEDHVLRLMRRIRDLEDKVINTKYYLHRWVGKWGSSGDQNFSALGIGIDQNSGNFYVCDGARIHKFINGNKLDYSDSTGEMSSNPTDVSCRGTYFYYVRSGITGFKYRVTISSSESDFESGKFTPGSSLYYRDLVVDPYYIVSAGIQRYVISSDVVYSKSLGSPVCIRGSSGYIYVCDGSSIKRISYTFDSSSSFTDIKTGFSGAKGFDLSSGDSSSDRICVCDPANARLYLMQANDGTLVQSVGSSVLSSPQGVNIYGDYLICTDNGTNKRLYVFKKITGKSVRTSWQAYSASVKTDITDYPDLDALTQNNAVVAAKHITDMRTALEWLAATEVFVDSDGKPFNWTSSDVKNLYYCAMGNRTKYGATGGAKYTWTRSLASMVGTPTYDIDIGEIYECVAKLEGATVAS